LNSRLIPPTILEMRRVLLTLALLAVTGVLTACGVTSSVDPVAAAATKTENAGGYKLTMTTKMTAAGVGFSITAQGVFDRDRGELEMNMNDLLKQSGAPAGTDATMKAIYLTEDGDPVLYMRLGLLAGQLPAGKTWMRIDLEKAGKGLGLDFNQLMGGAAQNPTSSLDLLRSSADFSEVGKETIDGVETTHYHGVVDLQKASKTAGLSSSVIQRLTEMGAPSHYPMDVWVDDAGLIRRFTSRYDQAFSGKVVTLEMTMDMSDYGMAVDVTAPPADEVFDATALATQGAQSQFGATTTTSTATG
jgi:hypothetical protein